MDFDFSFVGSDNKFGKPIPMRELAEESAKYLATEQWGLHGNPNIHFPERLIGPPNLPYNLFDFTREKKMINRKSLRCSF